MVKNNGLNVKNEQTFICCRFCGSSVKWLDEEFDQNKSYRERKLPKFPGEWRHVIKSNISSTYDEYMVCSQCFNLDRDFSTL